MNKTTGIIALTVVLCCLSPVQGGIGARRPHTAVMLAELEDGPLRENSGIAASRKNPGVIWAHNDSGDAACVYAVDTQGRSLARCTFGGVEAGDCEDIAIGPGPAKGVDYIYLADIGDNRAVRQYVKVYRAVEPTVSRQPVLQDIDLQNVETLRLRYPDGACDSETLMIDPLTADIYIISKRHERSRLYRAVWPDDTGQTVTLQYKCSLPWGWATGGDISADGTAVIVRNNYTASLWKRRRGTALEEAFTSAVEHIMLTWEPQGEAICFDPTGSGYYTCSEGYRPPIYHYLRPEATASPGRIIFADDFEAYPDTSGLLAVAGGSLNRWVVAGNGVVKLIRSAGHSGKNAVSMRSADTGTADMSTGIYHVREIANTQSDGALSVEGFIAFDGINACQVLFESRLQTPCRDSDDHARPGIAVMQYDGPTKTWQYKGPEGVWHALSTSRSYAQKPRAWHFFRLTADFEAGEYVSFQFDDETWFFSTELNIEKTADTERTVHRVGISLIPYAASPRSSVIVTVDDIVVRRNI